MELKVLQGAKEILTKNHPIIFFESWNDEIFLQIKEYLNQFGYNNFTNIDEFNWKAEVLDK